MRPIELCFTNLFSLSRISDDDLNRFTVELIDRCAADARFVHLVGPVMDAREGYFGAITTEADVISIRIGLTNSVGKSLESFKSLVSQHEGWFRSQWGKDSSEYLRFFPGGVTEYRTASLKNVDERMGRFEKALKAYRKVVPKNIYDAFLATGGEGVLRGVIPRFRSARKAQVKAHGEIRARKNDASSNRVLLEKQLMRMLLLVAAEVALGTDADREAALKLFPVHVIGISAARKRKSGDPKKVQGKAKAGKAQDADGADEETEAYDDTDSGSDSGAETVTEVTSEQTAAAPVARQAAVTGDNNSPTESNGVSLSS